MSVETRPKPKRLRRGLIDEACGETSSMPLRRDAPSGKSTVSMTDVVEMSVGSEMSDFWKVLLRGPARFAARRPDPTGATMPGAKDCPTGVEAAEIGGVELAENGVAIGEGRVNPGIAPGLRGLGVDRGFAGRPTCNPEPGWLKLGDARGDGIPLGACTGCGGGKRPLCSKLAKESALLLWIPRPLTLPNSFVRFTC